MNYPGQNRMMVAQKRFPGSHANCCGPSAAQGGWDEAPSFQ
jgi:hypothetical protein